MRKGTHPRTALGQTAAQMIRRYYLHDVARDSAALTYYLLFAIFPLLIFVSTLLGIFGIAAALNGHLFKKVGWPLRILLVVGGLGMMIPGTVTDLAGLLLVGAIVAYQYLSNKRASASAAA